VYTIGSHIGEVVSLTPQLGSPYRQEDSVYSILLEVDPTPTATVPLEGLGQLKK
jgi:hypothetical protein